MGNNKIAELSDVCFAYGGTPVLENVNLLINEHDFVGVVGANGSGKTTLLKLLLGHLSPQKGDIRYYCNGQVVSSVTIGYLPQYTAVDKHFPISVREVVETGLISPVTMWRPFISNDEARRVSDTIEFMGLANLVSKPVNELSGGELQRTMLARAIVSSPRMLLLDEPDTYLDADSETRLLGLLKNINRNCAILLVSHNVATVQNYCDYVVSINRTLNVCHMGQ